MIKRNIIVLIICLVSHFAFAQKFSIYLADKEFDQYNYLKAVEYYNSALQKDSSNVHVLRRLAQSYHKMGKLNESGSYYKLLVERPDHESKDMLQFADLLRENGQYHQAREYYQEYLKNGKDDPEILKLIEQMRLLEKLQASTFQCSVSNADFNSEYSDFAPAFYQDKIVFSSGRKSKRFRADRYGWNGQYFLELFSTTADSVQADVNRFAKGIGSKYHEGVICFSKDYSQMFFTRSNYYKGKLNRDANGVNNLKIFIAKNENGKWRIVSEFPYNSDEYSVGHPSLSADGKTLYFVSDMPGGFGGTDIYKSEFVNGKWNKPSNLGAKINSEGNEMFPHIAGDLLFFASNGHAGMGGLDIYQTTVSSGFAMLKHLGKPLNTNGDDFALIFNPKSWNGYFSSNRINGKGDDDIYQFQISKTNKLRFQVRNAETQEFILADQILIDDQEDNALQLNVDTKFYAKNIVREQKYRLHIEKSGFISLDTTVYSHLFDNDMTCIYDMHPEPVVEEIAAVQPDSIQPIYFDYDKADITAESSRIMSHLIEYLQASDMKLVVVANTDVRGSVNYNQILAEKRAQSAIDYLLDQGIDRNRIAVRINGKLKPLVHQENQSDEDWHKLNRRVDFELKNQD